METGTVLKNTANGLLLVITALTWGYLLLSVVAIPLLFFVCLLVTSLTGGDLSQSQAGQIFLYAFILAVLNISSIAPIVLGAWLTILSAYAILYAVIIIPRLIESYSHYQLNHLWGMLESENATNRLYAVRECGSRRLLTAEDKLTSMVLTDPDLDVRLAAYDVMEGFSRPKMGVILNALNDAPNNGYKINLIKLLGKITKNRQVFALTDLYLKDSDVDVRLAILAVFDGFYPADTVDLLLKMMSASEDKKLKLKLLSVLHKYDHILTVEPLVKMLKTETDRDVRLAIYSVLGDIKDVRSNEVFFQALQDGDPEIRNLAAETLKRLGIKFANRDVVKEIVKAPCKYCGTLVEVTCSNCISCGAPLQR